MDKLQFIDLFCGIGGFRIAFQNAGCQCVFSSDVNKYSRITYQRNFGETPSGDIFSIKSEDIPSHQILCAGFPCQPFSIAGVSKKKSMGLAHGFEDKKQGNLFFEIERILRHHRPDAFVLENVKNLISHDKGNTFSVICEILNDLKYDLHTKVIDASSVVPQHRERIFIVGFRQKTNFVFPQFPSGGPKLHTILEKEHNPKYTLSDKLWEYLQHHAKKHAQRGNGFGFGMCQLDGISRTLSARYGKDGSEILIPQVGNNPRRLTPRECARLMGYPESFIIPVSDTQAYRQFGNSVVIPIVEKIAQSVVKYLRGEIKSTTHA